MGILSFLFGCGSKDKPRGADFSKTGDAAFYRDAVIEGAKIASFEALDDHHAKDVARVYYCKTYRVSEDYFTSKRNRIQVIDGADAASFRLMKAGYARDARRIYYEGAAFEVRDVDSFEILESLFARDRVSGYYAQSEIPGSEGSGFVVLDSHYSRDGAHVYHSDLGPGTDGSPPVVTSIRISGAQPESFRVLESGYAIDAGRAYHEGEPLTDEVAAFELLHYGYAKSGSQVFYDGEVIVGADAGSFDVLVSPSEEGDAKDAKARYLQGKRVKVSS